MNQFDKLFDKLLYEAKQQPTKIGRHGERIVYVLGGLYHNEDGPAIINPGHNKSWYIHGELHREDGPARVYDAGHVEYWLHNKELTKAEFDKHIKKNKFKQEMSQQEDKMFDDDFLNGL